MIGPLVKVATDSITCERKDNGTKLIYSVGEVPDIPPDWSAIIGDSFFNLRSAWDHLAWQLVELDGGKPCEHTQFPIYDTRLNSKGNPRNVTIQPEIKRADILAALDAIQPYQEADRWHSQLWVVNEFCRRDKHRTLLTVAGVMDTDRNTPWWSLGLDDKTPGWVFNLEPLTSGDWVACFTFDKAAPDYFDPNIAIDVTLREGPEGHWSRVQSVGRLLMGLRKILTMHMDVHFTPLFTNEAPLWTSFRDW